jgi:catalase
MQKKVFAPCALAVLFGLGAPLTIAAENGVTANQVVTALEGTFGVHPGERRNHIKGTCAAGEFIGSNDAARYTRSVLFSGKPCSTRLFSGLPAPKRSST